MIETILQTAIEATEAAATILLPKVNRPQTSTEKGYMDIVTESDLAADQAIQAVIRARHPDHYILSEESPAAKQIGSWQPQGYWWCLDPIDGTSNFARGLPSWSISVAVGHDHDLIAGVVYDVTRHDIFSAGKGLGAFLNGDRIQAKNDITLQWSLINTDWHTLAPKRELQMRIIDDILPDVRSLRCWGTSALALAHIAAGFQDTYFKLDFNLWDVAAGMILIQEAGGRITTLDGQPWHIKSPDFLATGGGEFHQVLLDRFNPYLAELPKVR